MRRVQGQKIEYSWHKLDLQKRHIKYCFFPLEMPFLVTDIAPRNSNGSGGEKVIHKPPFRGLESV